MIAGVYLPDGASDMTVDNGKTYRSIDGERLSGSSTRLPRVANGQASPESVPLAGTLEAPKALKASGR